MVIIWPVCSFFLGVRLSFFGFVFGWLQFFYGKSWDRRSAFQANGQFKISNNNYGKKKPRQHHECSMGCKPYTYKLCFLQPRASISMFRQLIDGKHFSVAFSNGRPTRNVLDCERSTFKTRRAAQQINHFRSFLHLNTWWIPYSLNYHNTAFQLAMFWKFVRAHTLNVW